MKNRRGFTLVELLVCFTLITILSISLFKTVLVLQQKQKKDLVYNQYIAFVATFNNSLEKDLINDTITNFTSCGTNCYDINFEKGGVKRLSIDKTNNSIVYGTVKEKLPSNYTFNNDLNINVSKASVVPEDNYDSIITITIPIKSNLVDYSSDIKYVYQYDSRASAAPLYATLTINPNQGKYNDQFTSTTYEVFENSSQSISKNIVREGHIFSSWSLSGGGSYYDWVYTADAENITDATLTANWLPFTSMYTYTGNSTVIDDGNGNWRIKFLTTGIFTPLIDMNIDAFLVGGGGAGGISADDGTKCGGGGGAGGYTGTYTTSLTANTQYQITIGAGGVHNTAASGYGGTGGTTYAFNFSKAGGTGGYGYMGSTGPHAGGVGGSNGGIGRTGTGYAGYSYGSTAQGSTTCEFGEGTTTYCNNGDAYAYAGGGGGGGGNGGGGGAAGIAGAGAGAGVNGCTGGYGTENTGGGGGGAYSKGTCYGGDGGSGIVIIRNAR